MITDTRHTSDDRMPHSSHRPKTRRHIRIQLVDYFWSHRSPWLKAAFLLNITLLIATSATVSIARAQSLSIGSLSDYAGLASMSYHQILQQPGVACTLQKQNPPVRTCTLPPNESIFSTRVNFQRDQNCGVVLTPNVNGLQVGDLALRWGQPQVIAGALYWRDSQMSASITPGGSLSDFAPVEHVDLSLDGAC